MSWRDLEHYHFGGGPELATKLAALVLAGRKRASCWSIEDGLRTEVGKRMVLMDGAFRPLAVTETTELTRRRFDEVDAAFAAEEGEGDGTLAYWWNAHRGNFTERGQFAENMLLWCERFRVVERLDQ